MRLKLTAGVVAAVLSAWTLAGPVTSGDAWTLEEAGGISSVGSGEGEHLPGGVGIERGATEPLPVNQKIEEEFEADPPWQQAKEREQREAQEREAAQHAAVERETREAQERDEAEAQQRAQGAAPTLRCVVPRLQGDTLAHARHTLRADHCTLGRVHYEPGHRASFVVCAESPTSGRSLSPQAPVKVTLGPATRHHR